MISEAEHKRLTRGSVLNDDRTSPAQRDLQFEKNFGYEF